MLLLKQLNLKKNLLIIEAHPITVRKTTQAGLHLTDSTINAQDSAQRFRTGTVIATGEVEDSILSSFLLKGKPLTTFQDLVVLFDASVADKVDFNIEHPSEKGQPIFMNADYIIGVIDDNADVPSISAIEEIDKPAIEQVLEQVDPSTSTDLDAGFGDIAKKPEKPEGLKERIIIESDNAHGLTFDEKDNPFKD